MAADESHDDRTRDFVALTSGTRVSHYRIVEKIGAGGMGEVYLAEDTQLKRKVALKFMPVRYQDDPDARARFMREAQAAAVLNHQNIVTVYEIGEYNDRPFIAKEHCPGLVLRDYRIGKTLSLDQILDLIISITDGLQAAHSSGIVHRDLKPSNIVIDEFGKPKLLDFGLASIRDADRLTKTGSTLGTIGYMAPEQISGKEVDHRSDLFSLGVILYELIALQRPFTGDNDAAIINSVLKDTPQPLARYCADVPGELQRIVNKLLEKNREFRYQSAADVLSDLRRLKDGAALSGVSTGLTTRQRLMFFGLPTLVVLILVVALSTRLYLPTTDEALPKKPMLAVLPFENLGDPADEYFADGITTEITTRLTHLGGVRIIGRASAMQYKASTKSIQQIGQELGADYLLQGSIRWDKTGDTDIVRITPQLVQVRDATHLWADNIERRLTRIFAIQADVASHVAKALDVTLLGSERELLESEPTTNIEAYDYYLKALNLLASIYPEKHQMAIGLLESAIAIDSSYAPAYAGLAKSYLWLYWIGVDRENDYARLARDAIERALAINPNLATARLAHAEYLYRVELDFERALTETENVLISVPDDQDALYLGSLLLRRLGRWNESVAMRERALTIDPRNAFVIFSLGWTFAQMRRYDEARSLFDKAIEIKPDMEEAYARKLETIVSASGDIDAARDICRKAIDLFGAVAWITYTQIELDLLAHDFASARARLPLLTTGWQIDDVGRFYLMGDAYFYSGMRDTAAVYYDSMAIAAQRLQLRDRMDSAEAFIAMGYAYSRLGEPAKGIDLAELAVRLYSIEFDPVAGSRYALNLAKIYICSGEYERAVDKLEYLMTIPCDELSYHRLRIDPIYDPLRNHPRFKALMEKYGGDHEI